MTADWDAIVVGAGPAGMAAAARLAEGGVRVALFDQQHQPGGQIYRGTDRNAGQPAVVAVLGKDYRRGADLVAAVRRSGASLIMSAGVWWIESGGVWSRTADGGVSHHGASYIVLATGAIERPVPVAGWTLSGVMTVGALQVLLKEAGAIAAGRLVLAGCGPLFYLFARQCLAAGIGDLVLLDTTPRGNLRAALPLLPAALRGEGWRYLAKGLGLVAAIGRVRMVRFRHVSDIRIGGRERAERVSFAAGGVRHAIACDLVGLHEGVVPHLDAARSLDCAHRWDEAQRCFRPVLDPWGRTSRGTIYVAGDAGGIAGAAAAEHAGRIAALDILHRLGRLATAARDGAFDVEDRARRAHLAVRPFLDQLYRPREEIANPPDAVIVCRCEDVNAAAVRAAAADGSPGPNQTKAFLRTGMGPCQGRLCGLTVSAIMARTNGRTMEETGDYRARPPLVPLTVGELAGADEYRPDVG